MPIYTTANAKGKYQDDMARQTIINYIINPYKTPNNYVGGEGVDWAHIADSMEAVAVGYGKAQGVRMRHVILSFAPWETRDPELVYEIARVCGQYLAREYQVVYAVHENTENLHIHIAFNAVSYVDGHRYQGKKKELYDFLTYMNEVLFECGLGAMRYVSPRDYFGKMSGDLEEKDLA